MAGKDNKAKKVARFAANELLGIDDMRRVVKYVRQGDFKKAAKSAGAAAAEIGSTVAPIGAGAKVGKVAGKAVARAVGKEASPKVLSAANKARGSGSMVYPKAASGKTTKTAAKRDVVVKTEDKTLAVKGKFIDSSGRKSIKTNTNKPSVRTIEKEVTKKQADRATASSNRLRYGGSKDEAFRTREAVGSSKMLPKAGKITGATVGTSPAAAKSKKKK